MKRKRTSSLVDLIISIIHAVSLGLSIAAAINHWPDFLVVIFVITFILCLIWSVAKPLFSRERLKWFDWLEVAYHFITIVVLAFFDIVNFKDFFTDSIIQIVCVIGSGFFTLYGVALSIKFNIWNEQDRERARAKPHVFPVSDETWNNIDIKQIKTRKIEEFYTSLKQNDKRKTYYEIGELHLYNSDVSTCFIKGMFINKEKFLIFKYDEALNKDSYNRFIINHCFETNEITSVYLIFGDMLGNTYLSKTFCTIYRNKKRKRIVLRGLLNTELRNDINCDRIVIKYYEKN